MQTDNDRIRALQSEAGSAGDTLLAAICQMALVGVVGPDTWDALSEIERAKLPTTREDARQLARTALARAYAAGGAP